MSGDQDTLLQCFPHARFAGCKTSGPGYRVVRDARTRRGSNEWVSPLVYASRRGRCTSNFEYARIKRQIISYMGPASRHGSNMSVKLSPQPQPQPPRMTTPTLLNSFNYDSNAATIDDDEDQGASVTKPALPLPAPPARHVPSFTTGPAQLPYSPDQRAGVSHSCFEADAPASDSEYELLDNLLNQHQYDL
ncbi:hypothetical protein GQ54DRAFT_330810 [Martensiomyces pterosporus]|nr:hypothetical protein GQ54DRAFT_330810 [Martensiomyces pterosporus]